MYSYICLEGTQAQLYGLPKVGKYEIREKSANPIEDGRWEVFAYADEEAIAAFEGAGINVIIILDAETVAAQREAIGDAIRAKTGIV